MTTATVKFSNGIMLNVVDVVDVRPADVGMVDESWFIGRLPDGRWYAWSDVGEPKPGREQFFQTEAKAREFWRQAAEAIRQV